MAKVERYTDAQVARLSKGVKQDTPKKVELPAPEPERYTDAQVQALQLEDQTQLKPEGKSFREAVNKGLGTVGRVLNIPSSIGRASLAEVAEAPREFLGDLSQGNYLGAATTMPRVAYEAGKAALNQAGNVLSSPLEGSSMAPSGEEILERSTGMEPGNLRTGLGFGIDVASDPLMHISGTKLGVKAGELIGEHLDAAAANQAEKALAKYGPSENKLATEGWTPLAIEAAAKQAAADDLLPMLDKPEQLLKHLKGEGKLEKMFSGDQVAFKPTKKEPGLIGKTAKQIDTSLEEAQKGKPALEAVSSQEISLPFLLEQAVKGLPKTSVQKYSNQEVKEALADIVKLYDKVRDTAQVPRKVKELVKGKGAKYIDELAESPVMVREGEKLVPKLDPVTGAPILEKKPVSFDAKLKAIANRAKVKEVTQIDPATGRAVTESVNELVEIPNVFSIKDLNDLRRNIGMEARNSSFYASPDRKVELRQKVLTDAYRYLGNLIEAKLKGHNINVNGHSVDAANHYRTMNAKEDSYLTIASLIEKTPYRELKSPGMLERMHSVGKHGLAGMAIGAMGEHILPAIAPGMNTNTMLGGLGAGAVLGAAKDLPGSAAVKNFPAAAAAKLSQGANMVRSDLGGGAMQRGAITSMQKAQDDQLLKARIPRSTDGFLNNQQLYLNKLQKFAPQEFEMVQSSLEAQPDKDTLGALLGKIADKRPDLFEYDKKNLWDGKFVNQMDQQRHIIDIRRGDQDAITKAKLINKTVKDKRP